METLTTGWNKIAAELLNGMRNAFKTGLISVMVLVFFLLVSGCKGQGETTSPLQAGVYWDPNPAMPCEAPPEMIMPIDLAQVDAGIWPYGAHGGGHPEGHPGIDFASSQALDVYPPFDGEITWAGDMRGQDGYMQANQAWGIAISTPSQCTRTWLFHVKLTPDLQQRFQNGGLVGLRVSTREPIGKMTSWGVPANYLHWGVETRVMRGSVCPASVVNPEVYRCQLGYSVGEQTPNDCNVVPALAGGTIMSRTTVADQPANLWNYAERKARAQNFQCADGSTLTLQIPAEDMMCNARKLTPQQRSQLDTCLALGPGRESI